MNQLVQRLLFNKDSNSNRYHKAANELCVNTCSHTHTGITHCTSRRSDKHTALRPPPPPYGEFRLPCKKFDFRNAPPAWSAPFWRRAPFPPPFPPLPPFPPPDFFCSATFSFMMSSGKIIQEAYSEVIERKIR